MWRKRRAELMEKIDFKKELKHLYKPSAKKVEIIDVPKMNFLMVDGQGDPNTSKEYSDAIEALYPVAYNLKFKFKKEKEIDYGVMPLEGLWWTDDMTQFTTENKDIWKWTMLIMQPEFITEELVEQAISEVEKKKSPAAISKLRFENFNEGVSAQILHVGPFAEEGPNIEKIHDHIREHGGSFDGLVQKHHEIYLSDIRRVAPEKMKIVLRQPYR
jgi:hypothetical protein